MSLDNTVIVLKTLHSQKERNDMIRHILIDIRKAKFKARPVPEPVCLTIPASYVKRCTALKSLRRRESSPLRVF
jgi:hypothetical protein